ncbi:MAG: response regulator [Phycisphaerales bacterium]|nr:response regulator [Phycisphaerales bacterium]
METRERMVMIVDDDAHFVIALEKRLRAAGYRTVTSLTADKAVGKAVDSPPDVILLDLCLNGADGLDVAAALRQEPATAHTPIIFVTGSASAEFKSACAAVGGKYFLAKPYDPDLLLQLLRSVFGTDELTEAQRLSAAKRRQPTGQVGYQYTR